MTAKSPSGFKQHARTNLGSNKPYWPSKYIPLSPILIHKVITFNSQSTCIQIKPTYAHFHHIKTYVRPHLIIQAHICVLFRIIFSGECLAVKPSGFTYGDWGPIVLIA
ncbi:hypothetical protein N473_25130 [Pseudoalteromonas luteoviolacea CPMOR-1]|uniref:Uncharacterized protein n=1 Tax=Pseudoalteromonas luteoviolacea CPMOR-1 TaxID=1365248 RepID=A0A161Y0L1_9GAMM|nr:hypothetical protein N473_25130 [Pseudoalteromonas luteoviolacea CPMOR-1]